jgi:DNA processing protein
MSAPRPDELVRGVPTRQVSAEELLGPLSDLEKKFAPPTLHIAGKLALPLRHPRVAIVGTRQPSVEGLRIAASLGSQLAGFGIVVSGLARGVDTAALTAAIDADGPTLAVIGTPLSRAYPAENAMLQRRIMLDHLAVSQFSESGVVRPVNFVIRNRTMALIADASVIVESGDTGGSLSQGWETLRLGRPLFVHEREFSKTGLKWPMEMARYGAIRFREAADIMDYLPTASPSSELAVLALETA